MPNRREFLAASGLGLVALTAGWSAREADSTWLVYAPNAEQFWSTSPFIERLKKIGEAGFTRYEFSRWKTKDLDAITRRNEEMGLQAAFFTGYPGLRGEKWKEGLIDAATDSAELGPKLGAARAGVVATDRNEAVDRSDQIEDLVDALKEAVEVEKMAESDVVLVLEPINAVPKKPAPLIGSIEEAAEVVKAVGSARLKLVFPIDRAAVLSGIIPEQIQKFKDRAGYYRLVDFAPPPGDEALAYAQVLRKIHDVGYLDPIGLGLAPKADPLAVIESIRKLDAMAKAL